MAGQPSQGGPRGVAARREPIKNTECGLQLLRAHFISVPGSVQRLEG